MSEKVLGIGGVFLKARDPSRLAKWYRAALGVETDEYGGTFMTQFAPSPGDDVPTVWSLFPETTSHFPTATMVNFRVRDLDAMIAQLRELGARVDDKIEDHEYGRFGWVTDPEGNRIELWQPKAGGS